MTISLLAGLASTLIVTQVAPPLRDPLIENCRIEPDRNVPLPAEEAGVVVELLVKEGDRVVE